MARSIYNRIYPVARSTYNYFYTVFDWLWRRFGPVWRFAFTKLCSLVGYVRLALRWRSEERDDGRPEADSDGRHGAPDGVSAERVRGWNSEPAGRLPSPAGERPAEGLGKEERIEESEWSTYEDEDEEEVRVKVTDEFYCGYDSTWETEEDTRLTGASRPPSFRSVSKPSAEALSTWLQACSALMLPWFGTLTSCSLHKCASSDTHTSPKSFTLSCTTQRPVQNPPPPVGCYFEQYFLVLKKRFSVSTERSVRLDLWS